MQHKETLFLLWLDDQLSAQQRKEFDQLCATDAQFAERVALVTSTREDASRFPDYQVPQWDPGQIFATPEKQTNWRQHWLSFSAMAMSACALLLVLGNVHIHRHSEGMTVSFGPNQAQLVAQFEQRLSDYQQQQAQALVKVATDLQQQQRLTNAELTNYLVTSNRQERREDFAEFLRFINQQRSDDQVYFARQLNALQESLYPPSGDYIPSSNSTTFQE